MLSKNGIGSIVVTYNRLEKLKKALLCFSNQIVKPDYIIIVDNASNDGTEEFLNEWVNYDEPFKKIILRQPRNLGGSGGFYVGLEQASKMSSKWIWVSDDDAFPETDAIKLLDDYLSLHKSENLSSVCTSVIDHGDFDIVHRVRFSVKGFKVKAEYVLKDEYKNDSFELNGFSYVGTVINKQKLLEVGLTRKDFFIWADDAEHSLRLSKVGKIVCVPAARVIHNKGSQQVEQTLTWKSYYGVRNRYVMYENVFPKRCVIWYLVKNYLYIGKLIMLSLKRKDSIKHIKQYVKLYITALKDGQNHNMGIHPIYRPGWKP